MSENIGDRHNQTKEIVNYIHVWDSTLFMTGFFMTWLVCEKDCKL